MQVVPAKWMALALTFLICAGVLTLGILQPGRAAADDLQVSAAVVQTAGDKVELRIAWRWNPPVQRRGWRGREELLAVSFDTRRLVFESDVAPAGRGATGETLRRLEEAAGPDGARRLYTIPSGEDGSVVVRFRSVRPGAAAMGATLRVHVVFGTPSGPGWIKEIQAIAL